jgi:hypothetical protein
MNNNQYPELKRLLSKWGFNLVLMLSLFAFTGFGVKSQTTPDKTQTTLVISSGIKLNKTICYRRALIKAPVISTTVCDFINVSRLHSCLIENHLKTLFATPVPLQTALFYRVKTSENSGDEHSSILG